jgi:hypothetical protein
VSFIYSFLAADSALLHLAKQGVPRISEAGSCVPRMSPIPSAVPPTASGAHW